MTVRYFIEHDGNCCTHFVIHNMHGVILAEGKNWTLQGTNVNKDELLKDDNLLDFELNQWFVADNQIHIMVLDEEEQEEERNKYKYYYLEELGLKTRTYYALYRYGIETVHQLIKLYNLDKERIKRIRNIGVESFNEIEKAIKKALEQGYVKPNDNLTKSEQKYYDELTTLINQHCQSRGAREKILTKLDELIGEFLEDN